MKYIICVCIMVLTNMLCHAAKSPAETKPVVDGKDNVIIDANSYGTITWGEPTNNLHLGVKMIRETSTNAANRLSLQFYLLNSGSTNIGWGLMAPPGMQLVYLDIRDTEDRKIPLKNSAIRSNIVYRNLREIPKNNRGLHIGHLTLPAKMPRYFVLEELDKMYNIDTQKVYHVTATAKIMELKRDQSMTPIILPPLTFNVP